MKQVLFVCLGNICRSPMAHGIFADLVERAGLSDELLVDSAGTGAYHIGEPPDRRTLAVLSRHGIQLDHRARQVRDRDFERFDRILAMDTSNLETLRQSCPPSLRDRVHRVLDPVGGGDVGDHYYGGAAGFEQNYQQLSEACAAWLRQLS